MDSSSRCERPYEVTSLPAAPPTASLDDEAPKLQVKSFEPLSTLVIKKVGGGHSDRCLCSQEQRQDEAPPPLPPPSLTIDIMEENSEEEQNVFPGADFLSVADVVQVTAPPPPPHPTHLVSVFSVRLQLHLLDIKRTAANSTLKELLLMIFNHNY